MSLSSIRAPKRAPLSNNVESHKSYLGLGGPFLGVGGGDDNSASKSAIFFSDDLERDAAAAVEAVAMMANFFFAFCWSMMVKMMFWVKV